jgi:DNA-binding CsgD family transcriptional regulator
VPSAGRLAGGTFARARVRATDGRWLVVRGVGTRRLTSLIADAHGLTERERRVTELVAKGPSTNEIGQRLHLSAYAVQDHLKSIFDKTGTGSRGELVARLFFDHYEPSLQSPVTCERED